MADRAAPPMLTPEQIQRALARLNFGDALEAEFQRDHEASAPPARMTLQVLSILLIAVTPLYDVSLLHAPQGFVAVSHMLQFSILIPFVLLSLVVTAVPRLRPMSVAATLLASVVVASGLMAQRLLGQPYRFEVPHDFPAITFAAVLFLGRMRLFTVLPWALLTMLVTTAFELEMLDDPGTVYGTFSAWMLFLIAGTGAYLLEFSARQSWYRGRLLEFQALRDPLTGLPNRRHFDRQLDELVRDAARGQRNVALLLIDIDHFKTYNDHFGHPKGDECLRRIGARLTLAMRRPRDFCARVGGEEFAAVWFDADEHEAMRLAESLRVAIEELAIAAAPSRGGFVTGSAGFVQVVAPSPADTVERICADLIKAADAALYEAKRAGRAQTVIANSQAAAKPSARARSLL